MQSAEPSPATPVGDKTIADYLVERIADYGVRHVFGIPGDYCIVLWERMHQSGLIQTVNTCDEQGSGFAGDAYARMRGLGVVCQTYGVGGFKSIHAAAQAYAERSPLLIISGAPGLRERARGKLLHHLVDGFYTQLETFEKVTVASAIIEDPNTAFAEIDRVLSAALRHRRPVYLEIPRDLYLVKGNPDHVPSVFRQPGSNVHALAEAIGEVSRRLDQAKKPVIWAGVELQRFGLTSTLTRLVEQTQIPFATTILGKGIVSELHPRFMGVYQGVLSAADVREYMEASDCVLMLGVMLTDINLGLFTANVEARRHIHATCEGISVLGRTFQHVELTDFVTGLAAAKLRKREATPIPRPIAAAPEAISGVVLQSSDGRAFPLPEGETIVGRLPECNIVLDDPGISRRHASLRHEQGSVTITDLESANGTFINNELLPSGKARALKRGDEIGLGRQLALTLLGSVADPVGEAARFRPTIVNDAAAAAARAALKATGGDPALPRFDPVKGAKITAGRVFEAVSAFLDDKTVVTADNGETLIAGVDLLIRCNDGFHAPGYYTSVGFAIPMAIGLQMADPSRRPIALCGDAAFQMTGVELSTAARFGLNPIVVVLNNGGYGSERPIHDSPYVDTLRWDFARFCDVLGVGTGIKVQTEEEMQIALESARAHTQSFVIIDVHLEKNDYSPAFRRFLDFFAKGAK